MDKLLQPKSSDAWGTPQTNETTRSHVRGIPEEPWGSPTRIPRASDEEKKARIFHGERGTGGGGLATQRERQREQEVIFVKVDATWFKAWCVAIHDQSDVTFVTDVNVKRLLDWAHTFLLDPKISSVRRDLVKMITISSADTCDVLNAMGV
jgi:hypothetical protein